MSEPTRYTAVGNGVVRTDPEGMLIAYGHYVELKAENARLKAEVERLSAELSNITGWGRGLESDLSWARAELMQVKAEVERLEHLVNYWRIESECDNARWLRCLEDLEKLRGKPGA
jgi:chromosome segregation ATPase